MSGVVTPFTWWGRLIGLWRLSFGFCPRCNCDAPEVYTCKVCYPDGAHQRYPAGRELRKVWRDRWEGR